MVGNYIVSFIGFLPANDPEVVVYVAIDNAKGATQYGGTIAAPIAKVILNDAIRILNIKKPNGASEKKYNYNDKKYIKVPNVEGKTLKDALKELKDFKVEYTGEGEKVIYQSPSSNERILEGEVVKLMLGGN